MYSQLRACIDALPIVDDHSHPGYAQACAELGMGDSPVHYLSPTASAALDAGRGYDWQRLMHREAYRLIYGLEGDLESPDRLPELDAIFQQKRQDPGALVAPASMRPAWSTPWGTFSSPTPWNTNPIWVWFPPWIR